MSCCTFDCRILRLFHILKLAEIHTEWEIKNNTLQTYGKNNIIDKIKEFIDVVLKEPYTHKIKILDVHVNREIYQPKQYRYFDQIEMHPRFFYYPTLKGNNNYKFVLVYT